MKLQKILWLGKKSKKIELSKINAISNINNDYLEKLINNYSKNNGFNSIDDFRNFVSNNDLDFLEVKKDYNWDTMEPIDRE